MNHNLKDYLNYYKDLDFDRKVVVYNEVSQMLYDWLGINHPALNVQLLPVDNVKGNDYNPNKVAPPEMQLLGLSIKRDGVTMPCVVSSEKKENDWEIVDGFHRRTHVAYTKEIRESLHGYLPCSILTKNLEERITSTVRHNLARGTHQVELSAKLIVFLKKHNWSDARIGKEIGMDADEVLRLKQTTGLAEAFADKDFSNSWEIEFNNGAKISGDYSNSRTKGLSIDYIDNID
jgi:ParB-like chromosome segregation protein Spo0J